MDNRTALFDEESAVCGEVRFVSDDEAGLLQAAAIPPHMATQ